MNELALLIKLVAKVSSMGRILRFYCGPQVWAAERCRSQQLETRQRVGVADSKFEL